MESVTDRSENYCINYDRNLVNYVATPNYLSRHLRPVGETFGYPSGTSRMQEKL